MTNNEVYRKGKEILLKSGNENSAFEAAEIFFYCFGFNRQDLIIKSREPAQEENIDKYFNLIEQRADKRPLQYILGSWSFMGIEIDVGEGVLIPREDTAVLVENASILLSKKQNAKILELCSGSGAISIALSHRLPLAKIIALEVSDKAFFYLCKNIKKYNSSNITPIKENIFNKLIQTKLEGFDAIIANPPYIPTKDIDILQQEVKHEPKIALDGGSDGLDFYKAIAGIWSKSLNKDGFIIVEFGINQAKAVEEIFRANGFKNINIIKDLNNIERALYAFK